MAEIGVQVFDIIRSRYDVTVKSDQELDTLKELASEIDYAKGPRHSSEISHGSIGNQNDFECVVTYG